VNSPVPSSASHDRAPTPATGVPSLAEGAELAGEFVGSGYREPPQLVYRPDGQVVRLPPLLYLVVRILDGLRCADDGPGDGRRVLAGVADAVSRETGRQFTADHIAFLIDHKLAPLGVTTYSDGSPPDLPKASPFLSFRFRMAVLPARATWFLGGLFAWLYRPFVLIPAVAAALASEVWVFGTQQVGVAFRDTLLSPASILLVVFLAFASAAFHEIGHGTACRYSGVRPGETGCGIYIVWPAFYTDITNSYRLSRSGRIRTDLGGVYFNGLFVIGLTVLYVYTGFQPLLIGILSTNFEVIQQLLPAIRFDGYYIVADLAGIPDLFRYVGPILARVVFRRPADERLRALKRWPQVLVAAWVLGVLPAFAAQLGIIAVQFPRIVRADWTAINVLASQATESGDQVLGVVSACVRILLLLIPVAGIVVITAQAVRGSARLGWRRWLRARRGTAGSAGPGRRPPGSPRVPAVVPAVHQPLTRADGPGSLGR